MTKQLVWCYRFSACFIPENEAACLHCRALSNIFIFRLFQLIHVRSNKIKQAKFKWDHGRRFIILVLVLHYCITFIQMIFIVFKAYRRVFNLLPETFSWWEEKLSNVKNRVPLHCESPRRPFTFTQTGIIHSHPPLTGHRLHCTQPVHSLYTDVDVVQSNVTVNKLAAR